MSTPTSVQFILGETIKPEYSYDLEFFPGESYSRHHYLNKPGDAFYEYATRSGLKGDIGLNIYLQKNGVRCGPKMYMSLDSVNGAQGTVNYESVFWVCTSENEERVVMVPKMADPQNPENRIVIYIKRFSDGCPEGAEICERNAVRYNVVFNAVHVGSPKSYDSWKNS